MHWLFWRLVFRSITSLHDILLSDMLRLSQFLLLFTLESVIRLASAVLLFFRYITGISWRMVDLYGFCGSLFWQSWFRWLQFVIFSLILFLSWHSVSLRRRIISNSLGRDIDPLIQTGTFCFFSPSSSNFNQQLDCMMFMCGGFTFLVALFYNNRQERFICRWVEALSDPRVTHELRNIWISYWSQVILAVF